MSDRFADVDAATLARLIAEYPLAWIVAGTRPELATPMPMLLDRDARGQPRSLLGHLPRAHPLVAALEASPRAIFLFQGPHAYITPEWLSTNDWAPTWNFAVARIEADVAFDDRLTDEALARLVAHMERDRAEPWTTAALGPRYEALKRRVIGFTATIRAVAPRFKLGQDETPEHFREIVDGLGDHPLAAWMRRADGEQR